MSFHPPEKIVWKNASWSDYFFGSLNPFTTTFNLFRIFYFLEDIGSAPH